MINKFYRRKYQLGIFSCLMAIALSSSLVFSPVATAKLFDGPVDRLPLEQRVSLRDGEVVFLGTDGKYTCRILVKSSVDTAWKVITDYGHYAEFLPGVISSRVVKKTGDRQVFEQINKIKTFVFSIESRVKIATKEYYPKQITFQAVGGDLKTLNGEWILEPVAISSSFPPDKVLMTYKVMVKSAKAPSDIFYNIYESRLQETIMAIKQEAEKRSGKKKDLISLTKS
ncbi:SRPBCC family protein [Pleurocapsa sp. FMAR1]|uniref:SRPBCC family protein n=1 Tax=Pleurocapsa sp. FMAR1 TaxID=3040204 RepID=UPI0029C8A899|nr:SRPBCC family protein [Pleurocapsa sp. FMAR1]